MGLGRGDLGERLRSRWRQAARADQGGCISPAPSGRGLDLWFDQLAFGRDRAEPETGDSGDHEFQAGRQVGRAADPSAGDAPDRRGGPQANGGTLTTNIEDRRNKLIKKLIVLGNINLT